MNEVSDNEISGDGTGRGMLDDPAAPGDAQLTRSLVVKLTWGTEAPERCAQALTVAATAVAAGAPVSLWLTGESSWFGLPGRVAELQLEHLASPTDLLDAVIAAGQVTVCTQCAARREITEDQLLPGVRIAGAAAFVEECLAPGAQALVY